MRQQSWLLLDAIGENSWPCLIYLLKACLPQLLPAPRPAEQHLSTSLSPSVTCPSIIVTCDSQTFGCLLQRSCDYVRLTPITQANLPISVNIICEVPIAMEDNISTVCRDLKADVFEGCYSSHPRAYVPQQHCQWLRESAAIPQGIPVDLHSHHAVTPKGK